MANNAAASILLQWFETIPSLNYNKNIDFHFSILPLPPAYPKAEWERLREIWKQILYYFCVDIKVHIDIK